MITYVHTPQGMNKVVSAVAESGWFAIDTETTGFDPYTCRFLLMAVTVEDVAYVIDATQLPVEQLQRLNPYLSDPAILKIGHNLAFDWRFIYHNLKVEMVGMYDTMLADKLLFAGLRYPADLKSVAVRRLGVAMDKEIREGFIDRPEGQVFTEEEIEYAGKDTLYLNAIRKQQLNELRQKGLERVADLEMKLIPVTAMMSHTGVAVRPDKLREMIDPFKRFIKRAEEALQNMFISAGVCEQIVISKDGYKAFNAGAWQQVLPLMHAVGVNVEKLNSKTAMRWDFQNRKKTEKEWGVVDYNRYVNGDDDVADALDSYTFYINPYLRAYAFYKGAKILYSTFIVGMLEAINPVTNRIHPGFSQLGAEATGRFSSQGPNFQNLPKNDKLERLKLGAYSIREALIAAQGRKLIIADYSGIELVILATLSNDEKLLYEITQGDVHLMVTREVLGYKEITPKNKKEKPHKLWRDAAKTLSYAIAYGTTGKNVADTLNVMLGSQGFKITAAEGDELIKKWYSLFPHTAEYLQSNAQKAVLEGYVTDTWGRRRNWDMNTFKDKWKRLAAMREGMNAPIQGTSATMTKQAMWLISQRLDTRRARIIICVHDEIVTEATDKYADEAAQIVKECMEQAIRDTLPQVADMIGKYESLSVAPALSDKYDK